MRYYIHRSVKARWSWRLALLSFLTFSAALFTHRFFPAYLPTLDAIRIFAAAAALSVLAILIALVALAVIWRKGHTGAGRAFLALFTAAAVLAFPLAALPSFLKFPAIHDVSTDTVAPPAYDRIARIRQSQANPPQYQRANAPVQAEAYPDIQPLTVQKPVSDVYSAVREVVKASGWRVWEEQAPETTRSGRIEAEDKTLIFGFSDDLVVRVTGNAREAKVDMRSSTRYGSHDLGRNAARIRKFMADLKARLAQMDRGEQIARAIEQRQVAAAKASQMPGAADPRSKPGQPQSQFVPAPLNPVQPEQRSSRVTAAPGSPSAQDPAPQATQSERRETRRQRRRALTESQRRFWEGVSR